MPLCPKCKGECDGSYCRNCGALFDSNIKCEEHPDLKAISLCLICRRYLCEECVAEVSGKSFCSSDRNYDVIGNWAVVYMANMEWEAQLRYSYLTDKDIPCQVDSASARNLVVVSAGLFSETRLLVPLEYVLKAEELLQELEEQQ